MTCKTEHPDFVGYPTILPTGFEDTSWRHDANPSATNLDKQLHIWFAYADEEGPRFSVDRTDEEGNPKETIFNSDEWTDVARFCNKYTLAGAIAHEFLNLVREVCSPVEYRAIIRGKLNPHDIMDANDQLSDAFENIVGRPLCPPHGEPAQSDLILVNTALDIANPQEN